MPNTNFSIHHVAPELQQAFADKKAKGVILLINSPGGSPVQASLIHDRILALKKQYHKTVVVVAEDTLASGAYLVASAADKIVVNRDTITGSIGVITSSFGFSDAMKKLGISRRVFIAGGNKDRLDPFLPISKSDIQKIQGILTSIHLNFIHDVMLGRQKSLTHANPQIIFSGDFWTGSQAVKLGLADQLGNIHSAMQSIFKVKHYLDYTRKPTWLEAALIESVSHIAPHTQLQTNRLPLLLLNKLTWHNIS